MIISQLSTRQHSARRLQCCFTSTETIREGDHRSLTSSFTQLLGSILPLECCFTSTETVGTIRDWSPGHLPLLSHNSGLGSVLPLQCCFTSTETVREGDPRSLTSSFTQLLGSVLPHQCCFTSTETVGTGAHVTYLFFHTIPAWALSFHFSVASRPQKPFGKGTAGHLLLLSHSSLVLSSHSSVALRPQRP